MKDNCSLHADPVCLRVFPECIKKKCILKNDFQPQVYSPISREGPSPPRPFLNPVFSCFDVNMNIDMVRLCCELTDENLTDGSALGSLQSHDSRWWETHCGIETVTSKTLWRHIDVRVVCNYPHTQIKSKHRMSDSGSTVVTEFGRDLESKEKKLASLMSLVWFFRSSEHPSFPQFFLITHCKIQIKVYFFNFLLEVSMVSCCAICG